MKIENERLLRLREYFRESCCHDVEADCSSMLIVGAEGSTNTNYEINFLSENDFCHLRKAFKILRKNNVNIDPNFTLLTMNRYAKYGFENFLDQTQVRADIILFAYIFSEFEDQDRWKPAVDRSTAKYIVTVDEGTEVGPYIIGGKNTGDFVQIDSFQDYFTYQVMSRDL